MKSTGMKHATFAQRFVEWMVDFATMLTQPLNEVTCFLKRHEHLAE